MAPVAPTDHDLTPKFNEGTIFYNKYFANYDNT